MFRKPFVILSLFAAALVAHPQIFQRSASEAYVNIRVASATGEVARASAEALQAHLGTDNPHQITPPLIGAATPSDISAALGSYTPVALYEPSGHDFFEADPATGRLTARRVWGRWSYEVTEAVIDSKGTTLLAVGFYDAPDLQYPLALDGVTRDGFTFQETPLEGGSRWDLLFTLSGCVLKDQTTSDDKYATSHVLTPFTGATAGRIVLTAEDITVAPLPTVYTLTTQTQLDAWDAKVPEAPADGKQYARKDGTWSEVQAVENGIWRTVRSAAATVDVCDTQSVYRVALTTASEVSINLSALTFSGDREARWELELDCQTPQALYSTWAANIVWDCQPELTVTGCYKFVMSSINGLVVEGKQTWPTCHSWTDMPMQNMPASTGASVNWYTTPKVDRFYYVFTTVRNVSDGWDYDIYVPPYCTADYVPDTFLIRRFGNHSGARVSVVSCAIMHRYTTADMYAGGANSHDFPVRKVGAIDDEYHIVNQWRRFANELEVQAYLAGSWPDAFKQ